MTQDPAGSLLSLPPPCLPVQALAGLARSHWQRAGTLHPLTSERDQNHRLDTGRGSFTLKLANPAEPAALTEFQTLALLHTAHHAPDLPTPRVVPAQDGRAIVPTPEGALRLLTWLPGTPLAHLPRSPALAAAIGSALGRLDATLATFHHPAADHHLLWDIRNAADLAPLTGALPDDLKPRIAAFLTHFTTHITPALAQLPRQVIHGDFNPHNLLADPADPTSLSGILDFGDMTLSHRICDLAVAASYLIDPGDPPALLIPLTQAYHRANPLSANEIRLLPDLITARLVTTLTISAWRAARYPDNAAYILRNAPASRAGLDALTDPAALAPRLLTACGSPS
ncbi:phosphotransferase [Rhodobacter calidifons]|uniref:Hydroxylysine kinase n=1 Tax=Rhodobacter calidifons TaxID=2715277 RepID=A0ABX0G9R0_9RHOB|nr:phosphotransferase [Rhodobacter calidifons]NHB78047.1 phosphotransferase [Rhodobacter calidifons]